VTAIDSAISAAATWAAAAVFGYLVLGLVATFVTESAGTVGRLAGMTLLLYPRAARTVMRTAVAALVGLGTTVAAASTAAAGPPAPPTPPIVAPASPPAEPLDWPVDAVRSSTSPDVDHIERTPAADVVVRRGDSLWRIAGRSLGRTATTSAIAAAWPRWWAANRAAIGDNPDLLRPGLLLRTPRALGRSSS
jgi:nucleoid-associated protein YgaU